MLKRKKNMVVCCVAALVLACAISQAKEVDVASREEAVEAPQKAKGEDALDKVPVAGKVIDETIDKKTNTVIWTLSNGAKVVLKNVPRNKKCKNKCSKGNRKWSWKFVHNGIRMIALAKGGKLNVAHKDVVLDHVLSRVFRNLCRNRFETKQNGNGQGYSDFYFCKNDTMHSFHADLECDKYVDVNVESLFKYLYTVFTNFEIDYKAIKLRAEKRRTELEYKERMPSKWHSRTKAEYKERLKVVYNNDLHFKRLEFSDYANFKFNKEYIDKRIKEYLNPADYTFIFARNVDDVNSKDDIKKYVETYLASIPAGKEKSTLPEYRPVLLTSEIKCSKIYGIADYSRLFGQKMYFVVRHQEDSQKTEAVANVLKEYLNEVVKQRISKKRMSYFWTYYDSHYHYNNLIKDLMFSISFNCESDKIDENVTAVKKELEKISTGNIKLGVLNKAKKTMKKICVERSSEPYTYAELVVIYGKPFSAIYEQQKMYDDVTAKDLQEMVSNAMEEGISCILKYPKPEKK